MHVDESERDEREQDEREQDERERDEPCTIYDPAAARSVRTHESVAHDSESGEGIEEGL